MLNLKQLYAIMPNVPTDKAETYIEQLNKAMIEAGIITITRAAAFLAQLALESGELRWWVEWDNGTQYSAYEGRTDLGNTQPGDGARFCGRGPIQLTGRYNYRAAGKALGIDLEDSPERAADPDVGFRVAGWYWTNRNINALADKPDFKAVTKAVNGGYGHFEKRQDYYLKALEILGKTQFLFEDIDG